MKQHEKKGRPNENQGCVGVGEEIEREMDGWFIV